MASTGVTFGGLSSGLDTTSIINSIVNADSSALTRMATNQGALLQKQTVYSQLSSQLQSFSTTASSLNIPGAFNSIKAASSDTAVATISAGAGAAAGVYALTVSKLAQSHKVSSTAQSDTTTALALPSGTFTVNGHAIAVDATDSLTSIAKKINGVQPGVVASLINGGAGKAYLTLTATNSGESNKVQIGDLTGSVASTLGLISGASTVRSPITNGAQSMALSSNGTTLDKLLGTNGIAAKSFSINGTTVAVDVTTDSLQGVADKINGAGITGVSATVASKTSAGVTSYQLQISGSSTTPTLSDTDGFLNGIGVLQAGYGSELVAAQDAHYTLDGVALTNTSNTITDAVPGVSMTLLAADSTTPKTANLSMIQDTSAVKSKVQSFVDSYNALNQFISSNSTFDAKSFQSGQLFGDSTAQQIESSMTSMLFTSVPGLTGTYQNLASIGFGLDKDGNMTVDNSILTDAISSHPDAVAALFQATGTTDNTALSYISSTNASKASASSGYAVNVTQIATKGVYTAGTAQTTASTVAEKLTFGGSLFGNKGYTLDLDIGSTGATTVAKINSDSTLKNLIFASLDSGGKLSFASKRFGALGNFTVVSDHSSSSANSGVGPGGEGVGVAGVDIAGTINGEAATGNGQFLTGNTDNAKTEGLQIQYTGSTTGSIGTMQFSKGIGMQSFGVLDNFTNSKSGLLSVLNSQIQDQITQFDKEMASEQSRLDDERVDLRLKFAHMETAIATAKQQATSLSGLALTSSSK